jgi:hypothetical protein
MAGGGGGGLILGDRQAKACYFLQTSRISPAWPRQFVRFVESYVTLMLMYKSAEILPFPPSQCFRSDHHIFFDIDNEQPDERDDLARPRCR